MQRTIGIGDGDASKGRFPFKVGNYVRWKKDGSTVGTIIDGKCTIDNSGSGWYKTVYTVKTEGGCFEGSYEEFEKVAA